MLFHLFHFHHFSPCLRSFTHLLLRTLFLYHPAPPTSAFFHLCPFPKASAPFDGRSAAAYAKYLDAQNQDRELLEQEKQSAERYLRRHHSVWMYFPHVELLFLLFAYQGASAAEARMIYSGCIPLVILGLCAMVSGEGMWLRRLGHPGNGWWAARLLA